jgi:hypothetical protein
MITGGAEWMREGAFIIRWGTTAASSRQSPVRPPVPCRAGQPADGLKRMSGRIPLQAGGHPIHHHVTGPVSGGPRAKVRLAAPALLPLRP